VLISEIRGFYGGPMYKLIKSYNEKEYIQKLLFEFYTLRPAEYGHESKMPDDYKLYLNIVRKYSNGRTELLDFGNGTAESIIEFAENGFIVMGLDILSKGKYESIKNKIKNYNAEVINYQGSGKLPFNDNSFELISSQNVFEHLLYPDEILNEFKRILKPNGRIIIKCPNWGGVNNPIRAMFYVFKKQRYFHFINFKDVVIGFVKAMFFPLLIRFKKENYFPLIFPRILNDKINFEVADDDAVHLCIPTSFKKWFQHNGFKVIGYNKDIGNSKFAKVFNNIFPMYATTNLIVAELIDKDN
jgi:SAM-dependent methyltransferase